MEKKSDIDIQPEVPVSQVGSTIANLRSRVIALGVPGLAMYSLTKGVVVGVSAAALIDGSTEAKLMVGSSAAAVAVVSGQTFWILCVILGKRFFKKIKNET